MSAAVTTVPHTALVQMQGHVIDSLTLTKVVDIILRHQGQYQLLDFKLGIDKEDFSSVQLRIEAASEMLLETILLEVEPHGAKRFQPKPLITVPVIQASTLPEHGLCLWQAPVQLMTETGTLPIQANVAKRLTLILSEDEQQLHLIEVVALEQGMRVIHQQHRGALYGEKG